MRPWAARGVAQPRPRPRGDQILRLFATLTPRSFRQSDEFRGVSVTGGAEPAVRAKTSRAVIGVHRAVRTVAPTGLQRPLALRAPATNAMSARRTGHEVGREPRSASRTRGSTLAHVSHHAQELLRRRD